MLNTQPLTTPARRLLRLLALAIVSLGLPSLGGAACGSEAVCPTGTQGDPCRPVTDLGSQPELPTAADTSLGVWDAMGADAQDISSQADTPAANQDSNPETQGADTATAPDATPDSAADATVDAATDVATADASTDTPGQPDAGVDGAADAAPDSAADATADTAADTGDDADGAADTAPDATTDTTGDTPAPADTARAEGAATPARVAALGPPGPAQGLHAPRLGLTPASRLPHRG